MTEEILHALCVLTCALNPTPNFLTTSSIAVQFLRATARSITAAGGATELRLWPTFWFLSAAAEGRGYWYSAVEFMVSSYPIDILDKINSRKPSYEFNIEISKMLFYVVEKETTANRIVVCLGKVGKIHVGGKPPQFQPYVICGYAAVFPLLLLD
jgi:hypothetical protein